MIDTIDIQAKEMAATVLKGMENCAVMVHDS